MKKYSYKRLFSGTSKILRTLDKLKINYIKNKKILWHITTPRSGSTSFLEYMKIEFQNSAFGPFLTFPAQENRFQNICYNTVFNYIFFRGKKFCFSTHSHSLASNDFVDMISSKHILIIQYRSIIDTLISLFYYLKKTENFWLPYGFQGKNDDIQMSQLIYNYVPWHINFLKGWILENKTMSDKIIIDFDNLVSSFEKVRLDLNLKIENKFNIKISKINNELVHINSSNYEKKDFLINSTHKELINKITHSMLNEDEIKKLSFYDKNFI